MISFFKANFYIGSGNGIVALLTISLLLLGCNCEPDKVWSPTPCEELLTIYSDTDVAYVGKPFFVSNKSDMVEVLRRCTDTTKEQKISLDVPEVELTWDFGDDQPNHIFKGNSPQGYTYLKEGEATIKLSCPCGETSKTIKVIPFIAPDPCPPNCDPVIGKIEVSPKGNRFPIGTEITLTETNPKSTSWEWTEGIKPLGRTKSVKLKIDNERKYSVNCKINGGGKKIEHPHIEFYGFFKRRDPISDVSVVIPPKEIIEREAAFSKQLESGLSDFPGLKKIKSNVEVTLNGKKYELPFFGESLTVTCKINGEPDYGKHPETGIVDLDNIVNNVSSMPLKAVQVKFIPSKDKKFISKVEISGKRK
jgi:hypothetical protein